MKKILIPFLLMVFALIMFVMATRTVPEKVPSMSEPGVSAHVVPTVSAEEVQNTEVVEAPQKEAPQTLFIRVTQGCRYVVGRDCVAVRSGPGEEFKPFYSVRIDSLFEVMEVILNSKGETWYKIRSDSDPKRTAHGRWYDGWGNNYRPGYIQATVVEEQYFPPEPAFDDAKYILIDESQQKLYAYEGEKLIRTEIISTGRSPLRTPKSSFEKPFRIREKVTIRYMQGSDYDLPGIGYVMYFTAGVALHAEYWHDELGTMRSHGCVNQSYEDARFLWGWATIGTRVIVVP